MRFATLTEFENWFNLGHANVDLEEGAQELGPFVIPTVDPGEPPWKVRWCIIFQDRKYIQVTETYEPLPKWKGRGGYRKDFSFHYGDFPPRTRADGWPDWQRYAQNDIRIDHDPVNKFHLHFDGEDHIPQSRVQGMDISGQDIFRFVRLIHDHRRSGKSLSEVFGFTVGPPA